MEKIKPKIILQMYNSYIVNFDYVEGLKNDSVLVKVRINS